MCYSGRCSYENREGDCTYPRHRLLIDCPCEDENYPEEDLEVVDEIRKSRTDRSYSMV